MCKSSRKLVSILVALSAAVLFVTQGCSRGSANTQASSGIGVSTRPNVILVIGDDHGWPYFGFMGDPFVHTPNIDELAAGGTLFTHGFSTASVCRPALQTLLTGVHPSVWAQHVENTEASLGHEIVHPTQVTHFLTLPRQLSRAGYRSYEGGKFWEGSAGMAGFDDGTQADISECPEITSDCRGDLLGWNSFGRVSIQEMWDFIDSGDDRPFFVWFAPKLPHAPMDAWLPHTCPYIPELWQQIWGCNPMFPEPNPQLVSDAISYYANITRFDALLAELLAGLENRQLRQNTLIVYVSDNGYEQWPYEPCPAGEGYGCPRGKLSIYDLGFRTPVIFNQPGLVPSGAEYDDIISFEDVYATILAYAGVDLPNDRRGIDAYPLIQTGEGAVRSTLFGAQPTLGGSPRYFARSRDWRYIWEQLTTDVEELYQISTDPLEEDDVIAENPLVALLARVLTESWITNLVSPKESLGITGRITTRSGGEPMSGIGLNLFGRIPWTVTFTEADGSFAFPPVPAGHYQIRVQRVRNLTFDGQLVTDPGGVGVDLNNQVLGPYLHLEADPY
jgi:arylsulfatase A-like enzyme